ncbi:MAG TPA: SGNH/GDSL hydrolase family protein [Elusimicrobiota bacterium]|nr:SGNH/GDSL hydrolase family protein [Elusimicrobiota bacterium]
MNPPEEKRRIPRTVIVRLGIAAVSAVLTVILIEWMLAVGGVRNCLQPDTRFPAQFAIGTGGELTPGFNGRAWDTDFTVNSLGLRGAEISKAKPAGTYRVLCLGDSCTFGSGGGIGDEETYPGLLGPRLRKIWPGRSAEVINAGVPGYSSYQTLLMLRNKRLEEYRPDVLVVYVGWNDGKISRFSDKEVDRLTRVSYWINRSRLLSHLYWMVKNERYLALDKCRFFEFRSGRLRVSYEDYRGHIEEMIRIGRGIGARTILMTVPFDRQRAKAPVFSLIATNLQYTNKILRQIADREDVDLIDLERHFFSFPFSSGLFVDVVHPGKEGHRLIAEELEKTLRSKA